MASPSTAPTAVPIESFGDLILDARSKVVRPLTLDGSNAFGLRLCNYGGEYLFMTGDLKHPRFHHAADIIKGLLTGADSFDLPLPDTYPVPDFLLDTYGTFTPEAVDFILEYMAGADKEYLATTYTKELARSVTLKLHSLGLAISNATSIDSIITEQHAAIGREKRQMDLAYAAAGGVPTEISAVSQADLDKIAEVPYGVITKMPLKLYERLVRRAGGAITLGERMKWPFAQMSIGDLVTIDPKLAKRAQSAVHVYANRMNKRFTTTSHPTTKALTVVRIEDKPQPL